MDFVRPLAAIIPGAQGRVLAVFAETTAELNLRTIARLSGVSVAQASRVLPKLVELGVVDRRDVPPSSLFRMVPENVASHAIMCLANARRNVLAELGRAAAKLTPRPASVMVFGSFARGEADSRSDLDLIMVRATGIPEDDAAWQAAVERLRDGARRLTGNRVEVLEIDERKASRLLRSRKPLWLDVRRDGVVVFGADLSVGSVSSGG